MRLATKQRQQSSIHMHWKYSIFDRTRLFLLDPVWIEYLRRQAAVRIPVPYL
jgi:hypothetical protein